LTPEVRVFTYEEAMKTFPRVRRLTESAVRRVEALYNQIRSLEEGDDRRDQLDVAFREIVSGWADRVREIGCEVKGLWLVDWDCGAGYYCWKYPEPGLSHFHGYDEGFAGRVPIQ
jgi:hypothetical protein